MGIIYKSWLKDESGFYHVMCECEADLSVKMGEENLFFFILFFPVIISAICFILKIVAFCEWTVRAEAKASRVSDKPQSDAFGLVELFVRSR